MGCLISKNGAEMKPSSEEFDLLASETCFSVDEVKALHELFSKVSSSIVKDGLIHKEEFQFALFRNRKTTNFFSNRVFNLFDFKNTGVIEFSEFIRSLSIFHPNAPIDDKIKFAFNLYDLRRTGYIEWEELKEMVLALLQESDLTLSNDAVDAIVEKTFTEADMKGDGRIDLDEWKAYVDKYPAMIRNMTLPYLKDLTASFPSFALIPETSNSELPHTTLDAHPIKEMDDISSSSRSLIS